MARSRLVPLTLGLILLAFLLALPLADALGLDRFLSMGRVECGVVLSLLLVLLIALVVTSRRLDRAGAVIRDHEERLRAMIEGEPDTIIIRAMIERAPEAIIIYDLDLGRIIEANARAERIFGQSKNELLNGGLERFYAPSQPDGLPPAESIRVYSERALGGAEVIFERVVLSGDGKVRTCEVRLASFSHHRSRQIRASITDISERKQADETLRRQSQKMAHLLAAMNIAGDGIALSDEDKRLSYVNEAMLKTMGLCDENQVIGRPLEDLEIDGMPIFDEAEIENSRAKARAQGQWSGEIGIFRPGQSTKGRLLAHFRELPSGGRVLIVTDITETRQREEEKRRMEQQLEQARKLEALGQLAAGVAHDFNNLLGAILGFAEFIADDTATDSHLHHYATRILKAGRQAKSLIGQILAFSHRRDAAPDRVDLNALVAEHLSILRAIVPPTTNVAFQDCPGAPFIAGQRSQIIQLLVNLVGNASEALRGRDGEVTILVSPAAAAPSDYPALSADRVEIWTDQDGSHHAAFGGLSQDGRYLCLSIVDTGEGMSEEVLSQIFDLFFTTKGADGGTGLGLAVVRDIVISHRGGLMVTTAPGQGSRFELFLPIADLDSMEEMEQPQMQPVAHHGSILLVDDSSHFGDMLMTALFRLGYVISVCDNPADAIGYVREDPSAWDLVITDQSMPELSGTDLIASVKALRPDLPCIICTGFPNGLTEEAARLAGADGLVIKPVDIGRFSLLVKDLIHL